MRRSRLQYRPHVFLIACKLSRIRSENTTQCYLQFLEHMAQNPISLCLSFMAEGEDC